VHGRTDLIEKGVDLDGRKYYKIYYQDEAWPGIESSFSLTFFNQAVTFR
jgi:hypothetical protein